ncbi:hypothetical protein V6N11_054817 [Hibiscus sabdariffa]|uniref:Uncharacterized protein n=1 Tax=Hibiscus sabdariffa TaxID=183260 RepID=A0ABR2S523_9ROSI
MAGEREVEYQVKCQYGYDRLRLELEDEHRKFINSMTTVKRNKILTDLCKSGITWTMSPKGSHSFKRVALKSQARGWNHFLKASLMPTTHNEIVSEERMELWHDVPLLDSDEALVVKSTMITAATWQQLTGVESKDKGKGMVK